VIRNYYKQDKIFDLTIEEKLPELTYDNEHYDKVMEYLEASIESEVFNSGETVYRLSLDPRFRPLQKKRVTSPGVVLKYIDEFDDHNYIYYDKMEKWIHIKDVLKKEFDDDVYTKDVIYPRVEEIFNKNEVMKSPLSQEEFKNKYSLLFDLLKDYITDEVLIDKYKDLFLSFPDPVYKNNIIVEDSNVVETPPPVVVDESSDVPEVVVAEVVTDVVADLPSTPKVEVVEEFPESESPTTSVKQPPLLSEIESMSRKQNAKSVIDNSATSDEEYNYDEIKNLIGEPKEDEPNKEEVTLENNDGARVAKVNKDVCSKCKKRSKTQCTSTFTHSSKDDKNVKCTTFCYDCLEKHTLDDH
jgi:hypothetical protein